MKIVGAMDVHRKQITFKLQDTDTGEVRRGRIPCDRESVRKWLADLGGGDGVHIALEATTGWLFVAEEIQRVGYTAHLAEPAETAARRGPKRRAKTDKTDCDNMVELLTIGRLPESWIPPDHLLEVRTLVRLRKDLVDERRKWRQRIKAQVFHQGLPGGIKITTDKGRACLAEAELSPAGCQVVATGLRVIDHLDQQIEPIDRQLIALAKRQPGCRALTGLYGVGALTAVAIWAEFGDGRRFSSSDDAVRYAGLDITVYDSDGKRPPGHLSRQGPEACAGRFTKPRNPQRAAPRRTTPTTLRPRPASTTTGRALRSLASCCDAPITSSRTWGTPPLSPSPPTSRPSTAEAFGLLRERLLMVVVRMAVARFVPHIKPMAFAAGSLIPPVATAAPWTSSEDRAAAMLSAGVTRSLIMSPELAPSTEIRLGDRARRHLPCRLSGGDGLIRGGGREQELRRHREPLSVARGSLYR